jgi:hypothetical protein
MRKSWALVLLFIFITAVPVFAGWHYLDQPVAPTPFSQQVFAEYQWVGTQPSPTTAFTASTPALGSGITVLTATNNPSTTVAKVVTTGITNPDVPRNLTVTTSSSTGDCAAGNVTVTGTNIFGKTITENLAITNAQNGTTTGASAFKTVTKISLPAEQSSHLCNFALAAGTKLGLNRCLAFAGDFGHATFGGVKETTAPTVVADATHVESNTAALNSAMDGSHSVRLLYYQNWRCLP